MRLLWCLILALLMVPARANDLPRVRAITAFVRLDQANYQQQVADALVVLRQAKTRFGQMGYQVQTLRIVTQPLAELIEGDSDEQALAFLKQLDDLSAREDFLPDVGPAMLKDGDNPQAMRVLTRALSTLPRINGSAIIAGDDGIHWRVIKEAAHLVRQVTDNSPRSQGNFAFAATAMLAPYAPFYPGAYHVGEGRSFTIGFEGANLVQDAFAAAHGNFDQAVSELSWRLQAQVEVAEVVGEGVERESGWSFVGIDPTPAPLGDVSIGDAIEKFTGGKFGESGTLTASLAITSAVRSVSGRITGYAGLMLPVMEDKRLAQRWAEKDYDIDQLLAYSAVCGTGLDTVPLPGDVSEDRLAKIFGDVAALAWKWHKPLSARLLPIKGKQSGDRSEFDSQYLFNTTIH
jgi:uncharacterized protein (UPF0210 family)